MERDPVLAADRVRQACQDMAAIKQGFVADMPNQLWVSDFTYVSSWQGTVYVAFVIDVFARKVVAWRVSTSMTTGFVLDALNQAIYQRAPSEMDKLIHHSDLGNLGGFNRSSQHLVAGGIDDKNRQTKVRMFDRGQIKLSRKAASLAT